MKGKTIDMNDYTDPETFFPDKHIELREVLKEALRLNQKLIEIKRSNSQTPFTAQCQEILG